MSLPENIYSDARIIDDLFFKALWLVSVTFALVLAILVYFMVAYRARPDHPALYTHGNSKKALGLTLGLALAVFVGIDLNLAWSDHHAFEVLYGTPPKPGEALVVQVFAKQFEWNFRYAGADGQFGTDDDICMINELNVPVDHKIVLQMQSLDVIHSFYLPNARVKQDVVPGLQTGLWFQINRTTEKARADRHDPEFDYEIACAQLCGLAHTKMRGYVRILPQAEFDAWVVKKSADAANFDRPEIWDHWEDRTAGAAPAAAATTAGEK